MILFVFEAEALLPLRFMVGMKEHVLQSTSIDNPILVTGIIRSGTTWVGKVLCFAPGTIYLHEPTNPASPWNAAIRTPIPHFYLHDEFAEVYQKLFAQLLSLEPRVQGKWLSDHAQWLADYIQRRKSGQGSNALRGIIKDPTALFSTSWMVRNLNVAPIVVLRHPLAIVKSLLRLGWSDRLNPMFITKQPLLMANIYADISEQDRQLLLPKWQDYGPLDRTLRWVRIMYLALTHFKRRHPNWDYVCYEKLTQNPLAEFLSIGMRHNLALDEALLARAFDAKNNNFDPAAAHQTDLSPQAVELSKLFEEDNISAAWPQLYEQWFSDLAPVFADKCEWT
jgi:hypothetical protein